MIIRFDDRTTRASPIHAAGLWLTQFVSPLCGRTVVWRSDPDYPDRRVIGQSQLPDKLLEMVSTVGSVLLAGLPWVAYGIGAALLTCSPEQRRLKAKWLQERKEWEEGRAICQRLGEIRFALFSFIRDAADSLKVLKDPAAGERFGVLAVDFLIAQGIYKEIEFLKRSANTRFSETYLQSSHHYQDRIPFLEGSLEGLLEIKEKVEILKSSCEKIFCGERWLIYSFERKNNAEQELSRLKFSPDKPIDSLTWPLSADARVALLFKMRTVYHCEHTPVPTLPLLWHAVRYLRGESFQHHANSLSVTFDNGNEEEDPMSVEDAMRLMVQREPVNIAMNRHYDEEALEALFGYRYSPFNTEGAQKSNGNPFSAAPNLIYASSEVRWVLPTEGEEVDKEAREVDLFVGGAIPPPINTQLQPLYPYYCPSSESYMGGFLGCHLGVLHEERYRKTMRFIARESVKDAVHRMQPAKIDQPAPRLFFSLYGQSSFLAALHPSNRNLAHQIYGEEVFAATNEFREQLEAKNIEVGFLLPPLPILSDPCPLLIPDWLKPFVEEEFQSMPTSEHPTLLPPKRLKLFVDDIQSTARSGDYVINAWDPNSSFGNGTEVVDYFDRQVDRTSFGLFIWGWTNTQITQRETYKPATESQQEEHHVLHVI